MAPGPANSGQTSPGIAPGTAPRPEGGQAQVRNLFPTPVAILAVPDADRINDALEARILTREGEIEGVRHSNWGGWQSPWDFADWCGPEGEAVLGMAQNLARSLTGDRQGRPQDLRWRMNAWANVNRHGQGNEFHTHPGAYWSATYYVRDGRSGRWAPTRSSRPGRAIW
jgi:hypothetical protein